MPCLVSLAVKWGSQLDRTRAAGREILGRAVIYVGRLRVADIQCSAAGYVVRSIIRDLVDEARTACATRPLAVSAVQRNRAEISHEWFAEHAAISELLLREVLAQAVRRGDMSDVVAEVVWRQGDGATIPEAAEAVGISASRAYRLRDRGLASLRGELGAAS